MFKMFMFKYTFFSLLWFISSISLACCACFLLASLRAAGPSSFWVSGPVWVRMALAAAMVLLVMPNVMSWGIQRLESTEDVSMSPAVYTEPTHESEGCLVSWTARWNYPCQRNNTARDDVIFTNLVHSSWHWTALEGLILEFEYLSLQEPWRPWRTFGILVKLG